MAIGEIIHHDRREEPRLSTRWGRVFRLTSKGKLNCHPYMTHPAWTLDNTHLLIASNAHTGVVGSPEAGTYGDGLDFFSLDVETGAATQLTDLGSVAPHSISLTPDGKSAVYAARDRLFMVDLKSLESQHVFTLPLVGGQPVSNDRAPLTIDPTKQIIFTELVEHGVRSQVIQINLRTSPASMTVLLEYDGWAGHVAMCPTDPTLLSLAKTLWGAEGSQRIWTIHTDGTGLQPRYDQPTGKIITHESWCPDGDWIVFVQRRNRLYRVHKDTNEVRLVAKGKAFWHPCWSPTGEFVVADTMWKDTGIYLIQTSDPKRRLFRIAHHESRPTTQAGHPHPLVSPAGDKVAFSSNVLGNNHVFVVELSTDFQY